MNPEYSTESHKETGVELILTSSDRSEPPVSLVKTPQFYYETPLDSPAAYGPRRRPAGNDLRIKNQDKNQDKTRINVRVRLADGGPKCPGYGTWTFNGRW